MPPRATNGRATSIPGATGDTLNRVRRLLRTLHLWLLLLGVSLLCDCAPHGPTTALLRIGTIEQHATSFSLSFTVSGRSARSVELISPGEDGPPPATVSLVLPDETLGVTLTATMVSSAGTRSATATFTSRAHRQVEVDVRFDGADLGAGDLGENGDLAGGTYGDAVLASMPRAYYRVNETSGSVAKGVIGADAAYVQPVTFGQPSLVGADGDHSVSFGIGGHLQTALQVSSTSLTLETLYVLAVVNPYASGIFSAEEYNSAGFRVGVDGSGSVALWTNQSGGTTGFTQTPGPVTVGVAHHIAVTLSDTIATIYVDGIATSSRNVDIIQPVSPLDVGFIDGIDSRSSIDEVAVYDRPLSGTEIAIHAAAWKAGR